MKLPELLDVIDYNGTDHQVVEIQLLHDLPTFGEEEVVFHLMNRHDMEPFPVSEVELINYRKGKAACSH